MKFRNIIGILIIIFLMVGINFFSSQTATESDKLSTRIAKVIVVKLGIISDKESKDDSHPVIKKADHIVRKIAHFSIYFTLALIIFIFIYFQSKKVVSSFLLSWIITTVYAMFDEYYQTFIEGRGGEIRDVIIDSFGALCATLLALILMKNLRKNK
ncbi:VanZ family protein [Vallitalea guaymasensis]|uniref:VanZ family protein n=1 Tax=Vallitalea guaymasensis TaxID=1185412 RepID=UPI00272CE10F|nr:VanZ family protein [Vallitalea guaymasensis]